VSIVVSKSLLKFESKFLERVKVWARQWKHIFYGLKSNILSLIGVAIIVFFILIALLAPLLAPPVPGQDPYICPYDGPLDPGWVNPPPYPPGPEHLFGTMDGFDIYYGCIWGARIAFYIGLLTILVEVIVGLFVGSIAGYYGGLIDDVLMQVTDIFFAFPSILLAMIVIVVLPSEWSLNLGLFSISLALSDLEKLAFSMAVAGWPFYTRLIRGEIIKVKSEDYVEAAKAIGCSSARITTRHILPNAIYPLLIMVFLDFGGVTLIAATLSFLGFGLGPQEGYINWNGYAEWGTMISGSRNYLFAYQQEPFKWIFTFLYPFLFIFAFVLGWSLVGDALRNILDPTLRGR